MTDENGNDNTRLHEMLKNLIRTQSQFSTLLESMAKKSDAERKEQQVREEEYRKKQEKEWEERRIREDKYRDKREENRRTDKKELHRAELWHRTMQVLIITLLGILASYDFWPDFLK